MTLILFVFTLLNLFVIFAGGAEWYNWVVVPACIATMYFYETS